jgi:hypothetical protein
VALENSPGVAAMLQPPCGEDELVTTPCIPGMHLQFSSLWAVAMITEMILGYRMNFPCQFLVNVHGHGSSLSPHEHQDFFAERLGTTP